MRWWILVFCYWRSQFPRHWVEFNSHIIGWKSTTTSLTNNGKYQYFISTNSTLNPGYHTLDKNSRNSRILSLFIKTKNSRNSRIPSLFIKSTNRIRATIVLHLSGQKTLLVISPPLKRRSIETLTSLSLIWDSCKRHFICNTLNISSSSLDLSSCYFCLVVYLTW
jgi:hypothetical protein